MTDTVLIDMVREFSAELKLMRQDYHQISMEQVRQNGLIIESQKDMADMLTLAKDVSELKTKAAISDHNKAIGMAMFLRWGGGIVLAGCALYFSGAGGGS